MGREKTERSQLSGGTASKWGGVLPPEAKTQSSLSSMNQNPSPSDPELPKILDLYRPPARKGKGSRGPSREKVEEPLTVYQLMRFSDPFSFLQKHEKVEYDRYFPWSNATPTLGQVSQMQSLRQGLRCMRLIEGKRVL